MVRAGSYIAFSYQAKYDYFMDHIGNPDRAIEEEACNEYMFGIDGSSDGSFESSTEEYDPYEDISPWQIRERSRPSFFRWWEHKRRRLRERTSDATAEPFGPSSISTHWLW